QDNLNFANFQLYEISGKKFTDTNGDGSTTDRKSVVEGKSVVDANGNKTIEPGEQSTVTSSVAGHVGEWSFTGLDKTYAGDTVYEVLPSGYVETLGTRGYTITGTSGANQDNLNFANFQLYEISGKKFTDTNGDGST